MRKLQRLRGHPGCGKMLREGFSSFAIGFCKYHRPEGAEAPPARPDVRRALVQMIPGCSSLACERQVSLKREPWL